MLVALSASGVLAQLQSALNTMWQVRPKGGVLPFLRKRLFCFVALLVLLGLMAGSMLLSLVLTTIGGSSPPWQLLGLLCNFAGAALVFVLLFTYVPDAKVPRGDVVLGALITAALFQVGRVAIGAYLEHGDYQTSYGAAAGSFLALLVWIYFTSIVVLFGAQITRVHARRRGHAVEPEANAVISRYVEVNEAEPCHSAAERPAP